MKGIARIVRLSNEGQDTILRFRIEVSKDRLVPVELRGAKIRGDLADGDEVEVPQDDYQEGDTGIQPRRIINLTTSTIVVACNPPLRSQVFKFANIIITAAAALTGLLAGLLQLAAWAQAHFVSSATFLERYGILAGFLLSLLVAVAFGVVLLRRLRQPVLPLLIAVGLGLLIALSITWLYYALLYSGPKFFHW